MRAERINFRSHFMLPPVQRRAFSEALKLLYTSSCCNLNNPTGYSKVLKYILAINFQYYMILCECSSALLQRYYIFLSLSQNKNKKSACRVHFHIHLCISEGNQKIAEKEVLKFHSHLAHACKCALCDIIHSLLQTIGP